MEMEFKIIYSIGGSVVEQIVWGTSQEVAVGSLYVPADKIISVVEIEK